MRAAGAFEGVLDCRRGILVEVWAASDHVDTGRECGFDQLAIRLARDT